MESVRGELENKGSARIDAGTRTRLISAVRHVQCVPNLKIIKNAREPETLDRDEDLGGYPGRRSNY